MKIDYPKKYDTQREMLEGIKYNCPLCYTELDSEGHDIEGDEGHFNETDIERVLGEYKGDEDE